MADKMPGRAAQTASSIPGSIYHAPRAGQAIGWLVRKRKRQPIWSWPISFGALPRSPPASSDVANDSKSRVIEKPFRLASVAGIPPPRSFQSPGNYAG